VGLLGTLAATLLILQGVSLLAAAAMAVLDIALDANPIGLIVLAIEALVVVLGTVIGLFVAFSDEIKVSDDGMTTLKDLAIATFQILKESFGGLLTIILTVIKTAISVLEFALGGVKINFESVLRFVARINDTMFGIIVGTVNAIIQAFAVLPAAIKHTFTLAVNTAIDLIEFLLNGVIDKLNTVLGLINDASKAVGGSDLIDPLASVNIPRLEGEAGNGFTEVGKAAATGFIDGFGASHVAENMVDAVFKRAKEIAHNRPENFVGPPAPDSPQGVDLNNSFVPNPTSGRTKQDIVFADLKQQISAERELLDLGEKRGQLQFEQQNAVLQLTNKLREKQVTLNEDQRKELDNLVMGNAERKIRNNLEQGVVEFKRHQEESITLLGLDTQQRERYNEILQVENAFKKAGIQLDFEEFTALSELVAKVQDRKNEEEALNEILGDRAKVLAQIQAAERLRQEGKINEVQLQRFEAQKRIEGRQGDTSMEAGAKNALDKFALEITDFATLTETAITNAFHGAEDALVEFVQTGKFNFSKLVDGILADLTRLLARQALVQLIGAIGGAAGGGGGWAGLIATVAGAAANSQSGGGGGGGGGSWGGQQEQMLASSSGRAAGGPVEWGVPTLVGEHGPEKFVPPSNGMIMPHDQLMGGREVHVHITNIVDKELVHDALDDPKTQNKVINILGKKRDEAKKSMRIV
jgi:lambda family phage tail tape measure protein